MKIIITDVGNFIELLALSVWILAIALAVICSWQECRWKNKLKKLKR